VPDIRTTAPSPFPGMGALLSPGGCTFRIWAPFASAVSVGGDFFHSGNTVPVDWRQVPLAREGGCWSAFVEGVRADSLYKFRIRDDGTGPDRHAVDQWRHDPYCRDAVSFGGNSVVVDRGFDWSGDAFRMPPWNELLVYELHVGTFAKSFAGHVATLDEAIGRLAHVADLGFTAIEILPAFDFETETSMGYNPALPFAIDNAYGELSSMKKLVRRAHDLGLAVILDVVYNHWGPEGLGDCLGRLDGWYRPGKQGIYFYPDDRSETPWGDDNRPDYGRGEVRQYIRDNAMTLLEELRADGLRLDSTVSVRRAKGKGGADRGEIPDGFSLLRWLGEEKRRACPWKILVAEDLQGDASIVRDALIGGMGLDAQWDGGFGGAVRAMLLAPSDDARLPSRLKAAIEKSYDPSGAFQRVIYVDSHDQAHDQGRIPGLVAPGDSEGWLARKIASLGTSLLLTAPGIPMLFMGDEFLEWTRWSDAPDHFMDWGRIGRWPGFVDLVRRLCRLRRNWEDNTRGLRGARTWVFHASDADGVLAFLRQDAGGPGDDVVVAANLRDRTWPSYDIGFPRAGTWWLRFSSDWRGYCADFGDVGNTTSAAPGWNEGLPCHGSVALGPYAVGIYSQ
jgi:1,4-alpha-glucan branching enzyme